MHDYPSRSPRVWLNPVGKRQKDYTCSIGCKWTLREFVVTFVVILFHLTFTVPAPLLRILFQEIPPSPPLERKKAASYITTILDTSGTHFGYIPKVYLITFASKTLSTKDFTVIFVRSLITLLFSLFLLRACLFLTRIWDRSLLRSLCKPSEFWPDVRCVIDRRSSEALCSPIREFPKWIISRQTTYHLIIGSPL